MKLRDVPMPGHSVPVSGQLMPWWRRRHSVLSSHASFVQHHIPCVCHRAWQAVYVQRMWFLGKGDQRSMAWTATRLFKSSTVVAVIDLESSHLCMRWFSDLILAWIMTSSLITFSGSTLSSPCQVCSPSQWVRDHLQLYSWVMEWSSLAKAGGAAARL